MKTSIHMNIPFSAGTSGFLSRVLILWFFLPGIAFAQKENRLLRSGNSSYKEGKFTDAEKSYRKALELNKNSYKGKFNLGTAVYKEKNFEESAKIYEDLSNQKMDPKARADVYYNLGNSLMEAKKYDQSVMAYMKSLLSNPEDKDTKYNLEYAKAMQKKQQEQQKKDQQNKKNQDKKDQDQKDKQDQNKDQNKENSQAKNQQDHRKISKEDAERMLEALKNDEKRTMQKVQKQKAKAQPVLIEKDW